MEKQTASLIVCDVYKSISEKVESALKKLEVPAAQKYSGSSVVLKEKSGFLNLRKSVALEDDPSEVYKFYVPRGTEEKVISAIATEAELTIPGRGSIACEKVELIDNLSLSVKPIEVPKVSTLPYMGICCIVQRGQGQAIVRAALDMGISVPTVLFGEGSGVRDKLGLLRITIPAAKEVIYFYVSADEADQTLNALVDAGKLDQPGKGFIFYFPIERGIANVAFFRGKARHAASMEQIISAIDEVKGNTEWRKRNTNASGTVNKRKYLNNLITCTLLCNEGRGSELVQAAMSAGAAGATIRQYRHVQFFGQATEGLTNTREMADLIIGPAQLEPIYKALVAADFLNKETCGSIEVKQVPLACTYLGG